MSDKKSLLNEHEVKDYLTSIGEKPYRWDQIRQALYKDHVEDISDITTLSLDLRNTLDTAFEVSQLNPVVDQVSTDGTNKVLFETKDGNKIEAVMMRHEGARITLCVSSQVGCPVKCVFCSTGTLGYTRNLTTEEIVEQVVYFNRKLAKEERRIRNIVFMGMGEPLLNYDAVQGAIRIMHDQKKLGIGVRHITISTSGIVPKIKQLIEEDLNVCLAVSLHAPNDELRTKLMPINNAYPLKELMKSLVEFSEATGKRIFYEYIMLKGKNDSLIHARELAHLLKGQNAHVNLIPFNPGGSLEDLQATKRSEIIAFQKIIQQGGLPCTVRVTLGQDIDAACGQLANKTTS